MGLVTDHPLGQLTLVRIREFVREPEALVWALAFPVLLSAGLGVAFRNRPPEVLKIATISQPLADALRKEPLLDVQQLSVSNAERALTTGQIPGVKPDIARFNFKAPAAVATELLSTAPSAATLDAIQKGIEGKEATPSMLTTIVLSSPEFQRR